MREEGGSSETGSASRAARARAGARAGTRAACAGTGTQAPKTGKEIVVSTLFNVKAPADTRGSFIVSPRRGA